MNNSSISTLRPALRRGSVAVWAAVLGAGLCAVSQVSGQAQSAKEPQAQQVQVGDTIITSERLDYDLEKKQYTFSGGKKVDLTSKTTHMTSDKMTVEMDDQNALKWSRCEGHVFVERKNEDDGTVVKGWGDVMEYFASDNKAFLEGHVTIHQDSARLAKPAVITGRRVDMDMKTKENVVVRTPEEQAKVHIEPKGNDPKAGAGSAAAKPEPEPVDLVADRIQMNSETQAYVATGHPVMVRPSSRLQAKKIRFTIDPKTNEVSTAYADDDVVFDGKNDKGAVMHATGDNGTYNQQDNMLHMVGNVHALSKDPTAQSPTLYECEKFDYNTKTGQRSAAGSATHPVRVNIPPSAPGGDTSKSGSDKTKPEKANPDKTKPAKPADKPKASVPVGEK